MSAKYEKLGLESRWAAIQLLNRVIEDGLSISNQLDSAAVFSGLNGADRAKETLNPLPTEIGGRDGPEPVRFGDWEKKGLAVDF